jgi:hypothetical protein
LSADEFNTLMIVQGGSLVHARCHIHYSPGALTATTENFHAFSSYLEENLDVLSQIIPPLQPSM